MNFEAGDFFSPTFSHFLKRYFGAIFPIFPLYFLINNLFEYII